MKISNFKPNLLFFIRTNIWIGLTVFIKAIAQLIILKIVTTFYGSSAIGYLGQVLSFITVISSLLNVGLINFLATELSKFKNNLDKIKSIYGMVSFWCMSIAGLFFVLSIFFNSWFSYIIFGTEKEKIFFIALSAGYLLLNVSTIVQGFFSAHKNVKSIFWYNLTSLALGLTLFYVILKQNQDFIPYAALAFYFSSGLIGLLFLLKQDRNVKYLLRPVYDRFFFTKILKFTVVMSVTGGLGALQQIYMRNHIINRLNLTWTDVGHWQALLKISEINLSFIGMTMVSLYLPSISVLQHSHELIKTVQKYLTRVLIIVSLISVFFQLFASEILTLIYSKDFIFLSPLLKIQMIGDIFKLSSWVFTYFFLAKLNIKIFLLVEMFGLGLLTVLGIFLSKVYLIKGLVLGQFIASLVMFFVSCLIYMYYSRRERFWNQ